MIGGILMRTQIEEVQLHLINRFPTHRLNVLGVLLVLQLQVIQCGSERFEQFLKLSGLIGFLVHQSSGLGQLILKDPKGIAIGAFASIT